MIRIERDPESPFPLVLLRQGMLLLNEHYSDLDAPSRQQRRNPVESIWRNLTPQARQALEVTFRGKCAYCESRIGPTSALEIDHFRPKGGVTDLKGSASPDHYLWLTLEWRNHYASCPACNRAKRAIFPVDGQRAEPMMPYESVVDVEQPMLIDPCHDDPQNHLSFDQSGTVKALTERGGVTIQVLNLNRHPLVEERRRTYRLILAEITESRVIGRPVRPDLLDEDQPYLAVVREALRAANERIEQPADKFEVPEERRSADQVLMDEDSFRLNARALSRVEIRNFKSLREIDVGFAEQTGEAAPWLMLLGENAAGKSSLLQAIGLALAGTEEASRFTRPSRVLATGAQTGFIRLTFFDKEVPTELHFRRGETCFTGNTSPSAVVLGFGALRYAEARRSRRAERATTRFAKLAPLLQPVARIQHPANWLLGLDDHRFAAAALSLRELLPIGNESDIIRRGSRILFKVGEHQSALSDLSAGYQTVVGMACAIMGMLFERWENLISASGIVLIDELDAHLHPRWKMRIVSSLRKAFPQVQFVASTHDPLVLRGIRNHEVAVLRYIPGRGTVIDQDLPPIEGMQVEDLLTSRHFGLDSLLDPETEARLTELYHLQSLPPSPDTRGRIEELRGTIGDREALGRNRREQLAIQATDEFLQTIAAPERPVGNQAVSRSTVSRLQALLDVGRTRQ